MTETAQILNFLPSETVRLLSCSQILTSVSSVVKELLENSIDAGSSNIQVKLDDFGLDLIEVKDDGCGISGENVHKMFLPGYTSKIAKFSDLDHLTTYGFRGQALAALCGIADVTITTKTDRDTLAMTYVINKNGLPVSSAPSHLPKGTIICVKNLFKALPVRKQFLSDKKKKSAELNKVENVVKALAVVNQQLRVVLIHNKNTIWQKNAGNGIKMSLVKVFGLKAMSKMDILNKSAENISVEMVVPKKDLTDVDGLFSSTQQHLLFINKRPVVSKDISKVIEGMISDSLSVSDQHPIFFAALQLPPETIDVNLEPNKTKILLKNLSDVIALLKKCLGSYYGTNADETIEEDIPETFFDEAIPAKRMKFDESFLIEDKPISVISGINKQNCVIASQEEIREFGDQLRYQKINADDIQDEPVSSTQELFNKALATIETSRRRPELSLLDWSRGGTPVDAGVKVVVRETEPIVPVSVCEERNPAPLITEPSIADDVAQFNRSLPSPSSQMGRKDLSGFTKFARIMRPKIIAENPNVPFTKVSALLSERWQSLTTDEKSYYQSVAKAVDEQRKTRLESTVQTTIQPKRKPPPDRPPRKQTVHETSIEEVKNLRKKYTNKLPDSHLRLIGQLQPNGEWIYGRNSEIGLIRTTALDELVLYQKMIASFEIPAEELPSRIYLTEGQLGKENWQILVNLETEIDRGKCVEVITNQLVRKNGFRVELLKTGNGVSVFLTHKPINIDFYVDQLVQVLNLYQKFGEFASMGDLRPDSVKKLIKTEVKRISNAKKGKLNRGETAALIKTWRDCLSHLENESEIFVPFHTNLNN